MISAQEVHLWAERFGVPDTQIVRDHLISHLLVALRELVPEDVVFFGGTALFRTHLPDIRLSEDIDLLVEDRRVLMASIIEGLPRAVRREFPRLGIGEPVPVGRSLTTRVSSPGVEGVRLQLVQIDPAERRLQFEDRPVILRYSDLPDDVVWRVPTIVSFVVMKMAAWRDRGAPRDLFDLSQLALAGYLTAECHQPLRHTTGVGLMTADFSGLRRDTADAWITELGHQVTNPLSLEAAISIVRQAVERALSSI